MSTDVHNLLCMFEAHNLFRGANHQKNYLGTATFFRGQKSMGKAECPFQNWQFDWPPISVVLQSLQQNIFQNIKQWSFKDYKKCPLSIRPSTRFRKDHKDFQIKICLRPSFNCKMFHSINSTLAILTILSPCTLLTFKTSM